MNPIIDHIQITVKNLETAEPFYDKLIVHRRKPGALHHLAFKVDSINEVDEIYPLIKNIGADIVNPPQFYPQHGENYYALFFKDLEGIKYEIVYDKRA